MEATKEQHICPKCGSVMVETTLDGSYNLDGSFNLSGYYCPECAKNDSTETKN